MTEGVGKQPKTLQTIFAQTTVYCNTDNHTEHTRTGYAVIINKYQIQVAKRLEKVKVPAMIQFMSSIQTKPEDSGR